MDLQKKGLSELIQYLLKSHQKDSLDVFLDLLLTPEEKSDIAMRYLIIKELLSGKRTQRDIAKHLNVSIAKITRGSNELKRIQPQALTLLKQKLGIA